MWRRKRNAFMVAVIAVIILGAFLNWKFCCLQPGEGDAYFSAMKHEVPVNPMIFEDPEGVFAYRSEDNFNFQYSDFRIVPPLGPGIKPGIDSLKLYLKAHPERNIDITGLYKEDEVNTSAFPDLGTARATQIKNYLADRGVPSRQINFYGKKATALVHYDSMYLGPVEFSFSGDVGKPESAIDSLIKVFQADPLVIRFEWGESEISLNPEEKQKLEQISRFIHQTDSLQCRVTGHTDNSSSARFNYELGLKRAEVVKEFLVLQGIPQERIITASGGETRPVASNQTEAGRAANRRTVVTIK